MSSDARAGAAQAEGLVGLLVAAPDAVRARAGLGQAEPRGVPHDVVVGQHPGGRRADGVRRAERASMTVRSAAASQGVARNAKLKAWCISSGRT